MVEKNDNWDFTDVDGDFSLVDELDILESEDFELVDGVDTSVEDVGGSIEELFNEEEGKEEAEPDNILEPSTLVEQKLSEEVEIEEEEQETAEAEQGVKEEQKYAEEAQEVEEDQETAEAEQKEEEEIKRVEKEEEKGSTIEIIEEGGGDEEMSPGGEIKADKLQEVLESFVNLSPDFEAAAVVSTDGFVISSAVPEGYDEARIGAMSAAILSLGERAAKEMEKGELETVFVEGTDGYVLVSAVNERALLVISTSKYAKLGLVFYELRNMKQKLTEYI